MHICKRTHVCILCTHVCTRVHAHTHTFLFAASTTQQLKQFCSAWPQFAVLGLILFPHVLLDFPFVWSDFPYQIIVKFHCFLIHRELFLFFPVFPGTLGRFVLCVLLICWVVQLWLRVLDRKVINWSFRFLEPWGYVSVLCVSFSKLYFVRALSFAAFQVGWQQKYLLRFQFNFTYLFSVNTCVCECAWVSVRACLCVAEEVRGQLFPFTLRIQEINSCSFLYVAFYLFIHLSFIYVMCMSVLRVCMSRYCVHAWCLQRP